MVHGRWVQPRFVTLEAIAAWLGEDPSAQTIEQTDSVLRGTLLLETFGAQPSIGLGEAGLRQLAAAVRARPACAGLQMALAQAATALSLGDARALAAPLAALPLPQEPLARAAAAVLRIRALPDPADVPPLAQAIADAALAHGEQLEEVLPPAGAALSVEAQERLLVLLAEQLPCEAIGLRAAVASLADEQLLRRTSALHRPEVWRELGLFAPDERLLQP